MIVDQERLQILTMVRQGQVSPEDGLRLLSALDDQQRVGEGGGPRIPAGGRARWLRLRVEEGSHQRVNVSVPLATMPFLLRIAQMWVPEAYRSEVQAAADRINNGYQGDIVHVDNPGAERVRIWVE